MWHWEIILLLLSVGSASGFIAGLFGIGGGALIVPVVLWVLGYQGLAQHPYAQHLAVGTSFAVMVFTSFSSMLGQHKKQAVDWKTVFMMMPGMIFGVFLGSLSAKYIPTFWLQIFFILFLTAVAFRTLHTGHQTASHPLPKLPGLTAVSTLFGTMSSWVGIGGGSLSVPFLIRCGFPTHKAIGTSSGLAWPIALAGAVSYLLNGLKVGGLPEGSLGFLYLPAIGVLSVATITFAPLGVKAAHKLSSAKLKKSFGIILLLIAGKMLYNLF